MNMKQFLKVTGSVALSVVLASTTAMSVPVLADEGNGDSRIEKTETVYAVLNGDGVVSDIVVSSWLHHDGGIHNIKEKLDLTDVKNVKTDEVPEENDGVYTWNTDGNDLYYQGKATEKLPVSINITYTLDGEEIEESDLAGKSGHLSMHLHMTNENTETKEINGKQVVIHPLFVAGGMLTLDNDHVSNVTCEQGKIVNDGSRQMLVFASVPGLKETLDSADLSKVSDQLTVGDDVVMECDVKDYESISMMMVMSNELQLEDGLDEDSSIDALTSGISELMNADEKLLDGSRQLETGTKQLINESLPLTSSSTNIRTLSKGVLTLNDGALSLQSALGQYTGGVAQLNDGVDGLYAIPEGAAKLSAAITTSVDEQHPSLTAGISALEKGITDFKNQIDATMTSTDVSAMMQNMETADQLLSGMADTIANDLAVLNGLSTTLSNTINSLGPLQTTLQSSANEITSALTLSIGAMQEAAASLPDGEAKTTINNSIATLSQQAETLHGAFAALQNTLGNANGMTDTLSSAINQLNGLQNDITNAKAALETLNGIVSSSDGSIEMLLGMQGAIDGACDKLIQGTQSLAAGANALNDGITTLQKQSEAGIDAIKEATTTLSTNNDKINGGMASLQNGTQTIADQSSSLHAMADGLDTLQKAFETLHDGASRLADGQQKFHDEGLSTLKEKVDLGVDELHMLETIIDEVKAMNEKYREYAGDNKDMDLTTRYVLRTKTEDTEE